MIAYLGLVVATLAFVLGTHLLLDSDGANLSAIWLVFVTLPWSLAVVVVNQPGENVPFVVVAIGLVVSAGLNAAVLGRAGDWLSSRP